MIPLGWGEGGEGGRVDGEGWGLFWSTEGLGGVCTQRHFCAPQNPGNTR